MMSSNHLLPLLNGLPLQRVGDERPAGLVIASVPVPRNASQDWSVAGHPTLAQPLGKWFDASSPRRLLLVADSGGSAPETLCLTGGQVPGTTPPPTATMETFAHAPAEHMPAYYWERSLLRIAWGGKAIGLAMGLRVKDEVHWWEHCNIVIKSRTANGVEVEMGGAIPYEVTTQETHQGFTYQDNPYIHKHNWVNGHIYARLHANGVCEIYAHHINSMSFDDGADFKNAVPVIAFQVAEGEKDLAGQNPVWDGTRQALTLGGVTMDLTDVARLATPAKPGRLDAADGFVVLQPYRGAELYGGPLTEARIGDAYWWRAEQEIFPRGMARTLRFSLSLNPARSPQVVRYLAPAWWYGLCEEFQPRSILPVSNAYDESIHTARKWFHEYMVPDGFEEGVTPQSGGKDPRRRDTPSAEGDIPGGMFLTAYRTGDPADYDCALRSTYAMIDLFVDHAVNRTRFPGHQAGAVAVPLQRMHGAILGWLETGDEYLLQTAQAVIEGAFWWHKNSWPRRAVGRDARFVHSQMVLYRYLGDAHYLDRTRAMIADLAVAQWPDGSFGDQGGGSGIHGNAAYIVKPWMGLLATFGVLDYLEQFPEDPAALVVVDKFVGWLMRERAPRLKDGMHPEKGTVMGWGYQHLFKGKALPGYAVAEGPTPGLHLWHHEYLARLMLWYSLRTGDPRYFQAYAESYRGAGPVRSGSYHGGTAVFLLLPWLQDRLWNATVTARGIEVQAVYCGEGTPATGRIMTPSGPRDVAWTAPGQLKAPEDLRCTILDVTKAGAGGSIRR